MKLHNSIFLIIVLVLAGLSGWLFSATKVKYGLDVQGGARFTLSVDKTKLTDEQKKNMPEVLSRLHTILRNRAVGPVGAVESNVQRKGADQFVIELPGEIDVEKARKLFITTAAIKLYHARNVTTDIAKTRRYEAMDTPVKSGNVNVYEFFERNNPANVIKVGTPEYKAMLRGWGEPILVGDDLANARGIPFGKGYQPEFKFTPAGAKKLETWSRRYKQENIAFVLDEQVLQIAPVKEGTILSDNAVIDGEFDQEFVRSLVDMLNAGALPVDLIEESSESVDPTIGKTALDQILTAGYISLAITALFIVVYYMFPGLVALGALILYALFTLTVLKLVGATFSLASIAGMILSVGMAVDANILIFERIKEELKLGKTLKAAIDLGFKRALPAIIDSNACTILTSFVLMSIGTGPVKGFASTLIIGVLISLFTAITVTRWLMTFLVGAGIGTNPKLYGLSRQWFGEHWEAGAVSKSLNIVQNRKKYFIISILTIIVPGAFFFMGGLKPNVEFLGGFESTFLAGTVTKAELDKRVETEFKGGNTKLASALGQTYFIVTVPPQASFTAIPKSPEKNSIIAREISTRLGFGGESRGFESVGPIVQKEAIEGAIKGVIISTLLIVCYLGFRFGMGLGGFKVGLRFSLAAIGALAHDILVVVALAALFGYMLGWEVSSLFITGMLTVVGFSTHDTIVIFDRIRENLHKPLGNETIESLINRSITQSIARSINTASTVIVTLMILVFFGSATPDLRFFNTIMLCGILSGTYSSIYNASPIMYIIDQWFAKKGEEHTLMGIAKRELLHAHVSTAEVGVMSKEAGSLEEQGYGQVKRRRASEKPKGHINIDEEP